MGVLLACPGAGCILSIYSSSSSFINADHSRCSTGSGFHHGERGPQPVLSGFPVACARLRLAALRRRQGDHTHALSRDGPLVAGLFSCLALPLAPSLLTGSPRPGPIMASPDDSGGGLCAY